jgi:integrase/recombinase XerD
MRPLRQHMIAALHLRGKSARTPAASVRAVRLLAQCSPTSPARLSAQALQRSCLPRKNVDGLAPASRRLCSSGLRFCSPHVLTRDWSTLALLRAHTTPHLPAVRSVEDVRRRLAAATPCHHHVSCTTVYRLGLRRQAALCLPGADIDGPRLQGHVPRGQGAKERDVPLPAAPRALLRPSWHTPRHPTWLFPATGRAHPQRPMAAAPMRRSSVPGAVRTATQRAESTTLGGAIPMCAYLSTEPVTLQTSMEPPVVWCGKAITPIDRREPCWSKAMIPTA